MMAGNPNWWAMFPPSSFSSFADHQPQSWSQLLLGDEDRVLNQTQMSHYQPKKLENWEDQILNNNITSSSQFEASTFVDNIIVKQQQLHSNNNILHPNTIISSHHTNKFLDFSSNTNNNNQDHNTNHLALRPAAPDPDHLSESSKNQSIGSTGGACKKARVHPPSSSQPPLKVRKEKLVDRITALHQIVSPFGKTDTASVLSEAIGYIRFLQGQIEALSYPYLQSAPKDLRNSQPMGGEEMMKNEDEKRLMKDLRSKGLCLVPLSCTHLVGADHTNHNNINNNNHHHNNIALPYWSPF
ncbi:transcription factor bHLH68 [Cucumis sativus]|uniref:BHLH domain-containing protein n=1 Tax=Cucumis sativus TaxID=3659 RepID=A0A0A0K957_CUCSA|nr:transcription factor bHLH68 [Cucumis sativus]KGN45389.1 hypothetical protein Csa_016279 [Cucumis sativus]